MASWHPHACRVCGARRPFVHISKRGNCPAHGQARMAENLTAMFERTGPAWDKWLRGSARGLVKVAREARAE